MNCRGEESAPTHHTSYHQQVNHKDCTIAKSYIIINTAMPTPFAIIQTTHMVQQMDFLWYTLGNHPGPSWEWSTTKSARKTRNKSKREKSERQNNQLGSFCLWERVRHAHKLGIWQVGCDRADTNCVMSSAPRFFRELEVGSNDSRGSQLFGKCRGRQSSWHTTI